MIKVETYPKWIKPYYLSQALSQAVGPILRYYTLFYKY